MGRCLGSSLFVGSFSSTRIFGDKCGHFAWSCWGLFCLISWEPREKADVRRQRGRSASSLLISMWNFGVNSE